MRHLAIMLLVIIFCAGCKEPTPPPETPETSEEETTKPVPEVEEEQGAIHTKAPVEPPEPEGPGPYDCEKDEDCGRTCGGGALNIEWFLANEDKVPDCKDGCAGKGTGEAICVDGGCVATDRDGNVDEYCTRKLEKDL